MIFVGKLYHSIKYDDSPTFSLFHKQEINIDCLRLIDYIIEKLKLDFLLYKISIFYNCEMDIYFML